MHRTQCGRAFHACRALKTRKESRSEEAATKLLSYIRKRLHQIARLQARWQEGHALDWQQEAKVAQAAVLEDALARLHDGIAAECVTATCFTAVNASVVTTWASHMWQKCSRSLYFPPAQVLNITKH
jgi:hypothetical protein